MSRYIAIDGGTTNIRLFYTENGEVLKSIKKHVGVGSEKDLSATSKECISELINEFGKPDAILASGMITSELGLYAVPHLPIPAGIKELHDGIKKVVLPQITDMPICFIPGLKRVSDDFLLCDLMRGEECEIFGVLNSDDGDCVYVLPGSHSKHITVENGKITDFSTFMSGEMSVALSGSTILKFSVDIKQPLDKEMLCLGCDYAMREGINKALFKVRISDIIYNETKPRIYSFFIGAVLSGEMKSLIEARANRIIITGQPQLAETTKAILEHFTSKEIMLVDSDCALSANVRGMIRIFEC